MKVLRTAIRVMLHDNGAVNRMEAPEGEQVKRIYKKLQRNFSTQQLERAARLLDSLESNDFDEIVVGDQTVVAERYGSLPDYPITCKVLEDVFDTICGG